MNTPKKHRWSWLAIASIILFPIGAELVGAEINQGSGASDLISGAIKSRANGAPEVPEVRFGPPQFYPTFYFVATATDDNGLTSDYSNEAVCQYTKETPGRVITLAWDPSPGTNSITNYTVHWSRDISSTYTNSVNCGTNLTVTIRVLPPLLTNLVVTVTATRGDGLAHSDRKAGPWQIIGVKTWMTTNPVGMKYWRAYSKSGVPEVKITGKWQP